MDTNKLLKQYKIIGFFVGVILALSCYMSMLNIIILMSLFTIFYTYLVYIFVRDTTSIKDTTIKFIPDNQIITKEVNKSIKTLVDENISYYDKLDYTLIAKTIYTNLHNQMKNNLETKRFTIENNHLSYSVGLYNSELENLCQILNPNTKYILENIILDKLNKLANDDYNDYNYLFKISNDYSNIFKLEFILNIPLTPITEKKITCIETNIEPLQCDICHKYKKDTALNCGHIYCYNCLLDIKDTKCPYCRQSITSKKPVFL
jgi:hypothetical protein